MHLGLLTWIHLEMLFVKRKTFMHLGRGVSAPTGHVAKVLAVTALRTYFEKPLVSSLCPFKCLFPVWAPGGGAREGDLEWSILRARVRGSPRGLGSKQRVSEAPAPSGAQGCRVRVTLRRHQLLKACDGLLFARGWRIQWSIVPEVSEPVVSSGRAKASVSTAQASTQWHCVGRPGFPEGPRCGCVDALGSPAWQVEVREQRPAAPPPRTL